VIRAEAATDEDYDEEQEAMDQLKGAEEEELQFNITQVIEAMVKTHGAAFLEVFARDWLSKLVEMSHEACLASDRKLANYIFCDIIEHCGEHAAPLFGSIMPALISGCASVEPTLRQPSAYGVGVAAAAASTAFGSGPWCAQALDVLCRAASQPGAREGQDESATDNVVSAIGTICMRQAADPAVQQNADGLWDLYLAYLPLRSDVEESAKVTHQLAVLVGQGDKTLLGDDYRRLPQVWKLLATAVGAEGSTNEVHARIKHAIETLQGNLPADQMQALWSALGPDEAQRVQALLQAA